VAVIGALSAVAVAIIANWSGVFASHRAPRPLSPPPPATAPASDFVFANSDQSPLDCAMLANVSSARLRIARNEIYARHGYVFASPDLRAYFSRFAWYKPVAVSVALSPIEQENVHAIGLAQGGNCAAG